MPGSGINKQNFDRIVRKIKAREYHGTKIVWIFNCLKKF